MVECSGFVRHIQFKASHSTAKTSRVNINTNLASKPAGCVIWIWFDPETMDLGPFLWFGDNPGQPLPPLGDRVARYSKANADGIKAERPNSWILNKGQFTALADTEGVIRTLFGVRVRNEVAGHGNKQTLCPQNDSNVINQLVIISFCLGSICPRIVVGKRIVSTCGWVICWFIGSAKALILLERRVVLDGKDQG